jgi:hypothetical protein
MQLSCIFVWTTGRKDRIVEIIMMIDPTASSPAEKARIRKPWMTPRIDDADVALETAVKTPNDVETPMFPKNGS